MARKSTKTTTPRKTSTRKTTTRAKTAKPTTAKRAAPSKPAAPKVAVAPPKAPLPKLVKVTEPVVTEPELRKKELIDLVVTRSGVKKKDAKPAVEALLAILGETVSKGRELNLQPFGKLKINRTEEKANGRIVICRLRQPLGTKDAEKEPLAEPAE